MVAQREALADADTTELQLSRGGFWQDRGQWLPHQGLTLYKQTLKISGKSAQSSHHFSTKDDIPEL
jgi:hypothetical protein